MTRVLLDTHALVWWLEAKENLSRKAKEIIEESATVVFVSAASGWKHYGSCTSTAPPHSRLKIG
jgi:PIN domain nuclease of toxin-antitoxin system